jgi:hypothetical protein
MALPPVRHNGDCVFGRLLLLQLSHDPHITFCRLFLPVHILGRFISQEERNLLGVRTQEESFLAASLYIAQHAHTAVDGFVAIAYGAESDYLRRAFRWRTFNWRNDRPDQLLII